MQVQQKLFTKLYLPIFLKIKVPQFALIKCRALSHTAPSVALLSYFPLFSFQGAIEDKIPSKLNNVRGQKRLTWKYARVVTCMSP